MRFSVGERAFIAMSGPHDLSGAERLTYIDPEEGCSRELWIVSGPDGTELLAAALLCGDDHDAEWYRQMIDSAAPVNALRHVLMFGQAAASANATPENGAAPVTRPVREKLVVIGNGMAGCRAVEELLAREPNAYDIEVFGAEPRVNYNRIMLSPVLAGEKSFDEIVLNDRNWYRENGITLHTGEEIASIDAGADAASPSTATDTTMTGC